MAGGLVSWSARHQDIVTLSTTQAKYIAAIHAGQTAQWITQFMSKVYLPIKCPIIIHTDSRGGQSLTKKSANFSKVQHLLVRYHWLHDVIHKKELDIVHIPGAKNLANIFTKALPYVTLHRHLVYLHIMAQGGC